MKGTLKAGSVGAAAIDLQRRALFVTRITPASYRKAGISLRKVSSLHAFFRAFAVLVRAGIVIRRALVVTIEHCKDRALREALRGVLADVEHGSSLSAAMARRPNEFPPLQTAMIQAGETGGILDDVLERIVTVLDRDHAVRRRVEAALIYPSIVAAAAGTLLIFLVVRVAPMFASLFERFAVPLPLPTRLLLMVATALTSPNVFSVFVFIAGIGVTILAATNGSRRAREQLRLSLPVVGSILKMSAVARTARMLGVLLSSGLGVLPSIEVVAPVAGSAIYATALRRVGDGLTRGHSLYQAMKECGAFDALSLALVAVGEETGRVADMLLAVADYLDVEIESTLTRLGSVIEPILIGCVGLVVGGIVFSIFLPLYSLIGSIQ